MKNSVFLLVFLFSIAAPSQNEKAATPVIAVKVPVGETVTIKGVSVKFLEVIEDSRCPEYVTCIWAGRAILNVEVATHGQSPQQKQLLFGATKPGETVNNVLFKNDDFVLEGLQLLPVPVTENLTEEVNYVLLLCERKS